MVQVPGEPAVHRSRLWAYVVHRPNYHLLVELTKTGVRVTRRRSATAPTAGVRRCPDASCAAAPLPLAVEEALRRGAPPRASGTRTCRDDYSIFVFRRHALMGMILVAGRNQRPSPTLSAAGGPGRHRRGPDGMRCRSGRPEALRFLRAVSTQRRGSSRTGSGSPDPLEWCASSAGRSVSHRVPTGGCETAPRWCPGPARPGEPERIVPAGVRRRGELTTTMLTISPRP